MKVLFISNFLNLHQAGLWDEFVKNDVDFFFLSTTLKSDETNKPILDRKYNIYSSKMQDGELRAFLQSFDVIILGACEDKRVYRMLPVDKIFFHNGEHYWKKYNTPLSFAKRIARTAVLKKRYKSIKPYLLANSSYLVDEFNRFKIPHREGFKFGYFPPINNEMACTKKEREKLVLCAGRLLKWKKPSVSLSVLNELIRNGQNYELMIVGEGEMLKSLKRKTSKLKLDNYVIFNGFLEHDDLIKKMKESSIFVFSSNHQEGWGAVLNEALSCGCVVFASSLPGSTGFLIKDKYNGFVYKTKKELIDRIHSFLSMSDDDILTLRENAFRSMELLWNEKKAADRLFRVCVSIFEKRNIPYFEEGPLSLIN